MCGIVGAAGSLAKKEFDAFNNLLAWDIVRGPHATGIAAIKRSNNDIHMLKRAMHAYDLMDLKAYDTIVNGSKVLIGHNRFATVGGNSHRNAHPFWCDNIIGVHNGTIPYSDRKCLEDHVKYDTDSEAIFWNINNRGIEETIKDLRGAWSLVWWDRRDHTLNFLRNKERPMFYTISESGQDLFWASEVGMLRAALSRNGVKHGDVYYTPEESMLSFSIPEYSKSFGAPDRKEVKGAGPFVFPSDQRFREQDWDSDQWLQEYRTRHPQRMVDRPPVGIGVNLSPPALQLTGPDTSSHKTTSVGKPEEKPQEEDSSGHQQSSNSPQTNEDKEEVPFSLEPESDTIDLSSKNVVPLGRKGAYVMVKDHVGCWIDKSMFDKRTESGCAYCQKMVPFKDVAERARADDIPILWLGRTSFLCVECSDDSEILDYLANCNMIIPERQRLN